ncbi:MAG TPA: hypothetical protein VF698_09745 [Thermoanaerobaculia bacterium]|jgi:hypothetical protein
MNGRALVTLAAVAAAATPTTVPRAVLSPAGAIDVTLPTTILRTAEVRQHLSSGLTTAFIATMEEQRVNGHPIRGAARIDVRYELWDETYLVTITDAGGRRQRIALPNYERFVDWWTRTALHLAHAGSSASAPQSLRLKVEVVPFSASEEADAQKWLAESVAAGAGAKPSQRTGEPQASSSAILDVIIGTSVQRRPILAWRWTVRVEPGR